MTTAFGEQLRIEWRLQRRRPFVWFCLLVYFALALGDTVQAGWSTQGYQWINGAEAISHRAIILSILGILASAGIVGDAMSRDRATGAEEMILVTGAGRWTLGLGRFIVTLLIVLVTSAMFIPGMLLGAWAPGIAPEQLGPLDPWHYAKALGIYIVPNFFVTSAMVFAVAARWRSQTAAYVAAIGLIALYVTTRMLLGRDVLRHDVFAVYALLDPFGSIASTQFTMAWTVNQNNTTFTPLAGLLLWNRLLWTTVGMGLAVMGIWGMPMRPVQPDGAKLKKPRQSRPWFDTRFKNELMVMTTWELKALWRQPGVRLLLACAAFSLWWTAASAVTHSFSLPTTDLLVHSTGFYFDKVLVLLLVWCAADLIWREQRHKVHEMIDVLPTRDTHRFLSKTLVLLFFVLVFWTLSIFVNLLYQATHGFYDFELWLHLTDTFVFKAPYYLWMAVLAISLQAIIRNRLVAMGLALLVYVSELAFDAMGLYHPLYRFGNVGFFWYSLMDGYGHFWRAHLWFVGYWTLGSTLLWLVAWWCYARGVNPPPRRQMWTRRRMGRGGLAFTAALAAGWIGVGAGIVYNTMVLNPWPLTDPDALKAQVETQYRADWRGRPQPRIVRITADIDIDPSRRQFEMQGELTLENNSPEPIDELLILVEPQLELVDVDLGPTAKLVERDPRLKIEHWRLDQALEPGRRMVMGYTTRSAPLPGFTAHAQHDGVPEVSPVEIVGNGSSLLNLQLMPMIGYTDRIEHRPRWKRRKYGLPPDWQPLDPYRARYEAHDTSHLAWVEQIDVTIRTAPDQTPLHAGRRIEDRLTPDGRREVRYVLDRPSRGWSEVLSGHYEIHRAQREGLSPVEIYYDPDHAYTVEPFAVQILDALAYFQSRYGPAPFGTFRMAQQSLHYDGMGARGGLGFATEILGWKSDLDASGGEDLAQMAAHLMGMTWWGDQIIPANAPGAKVLHAGLPYWTAALYLHHRRTPELDRRLRLQGMMETFRLRHKLQDEEQPFALETKDSTMVRGKGVILITYLSQLLGTQHLEDIFAEFLNEWRYRPLPYPTARQFINHLKSRTPVELHDQIADIFEHVTTWRLKAIDAKTWPLDNGTWRLEATLDARKFYTHGLGRESEAPLETPVFVAAFRSDGFNSEDTIELVTRSLPTGQSVLSMTLAERPTRFGIDPYLLLPDPNPHDNVIDVVRIDP